MFVLVVNTSLRPVAWNGLNESLFFIINQFVSSIDVTQKPGSKFVPYHCTMLQKVLRSAGFITFLEAMKTNRDKNSIPALMEVKILNTCLVPNSWLSWLTATDICVITEMRHFNYFQYFLGATEIIHTKYYLHFGEGNSIFCCTGPIDPNFW